MNKYLVRRLIGICATLLVVSLLTFAALDSTPGDAATSLVGESASSAQLQALRTRLGLDQPVLVRYAQFLSNFLLHGDLGRSLVNNKAVTELLQERLPYTIVLALASALLAAVLGVALGAFAAWHAGSRRDMLCMGGASLGLAVPTFWSAMLLMLLFSVKLRWLPVVGAEGIQSLILPSVTLALPTMAVIARLMRASLLDVMCADYVRTAHSKGLAPSRVLLRHIMRNSLIPVVTVFGLHLGYLLGGVFIVETIFGWPGLGRLTVQAIFDRDYPVVIGTALTVASMYIAINLVVDMMHGWLDPQVAHAAI
jgi:ABC-type dipeptide/oligopeptide/nickel transport system permease component